MALVPIISQTWDTTSVFNPTRMNTIENNLAIVSDATGVKYSNGVSVKDKLDTIDLVNDLKYVRGLFSLSSGTTSQEYITQTISQINTENKFTNFDVNISRYGTHKFTGYLYPAKNYGSGIFQNFEGMLIFWRRNTTNNVTTDYFYNITKAVI